MNVGCVIYQKDIQTGELNAEWHVEKGEKVVGGTGKATGNPGSEYEGEYEITYFVDDKPDGPYNLVIKKITDYFLLSWFQDGTLKYSGIGMLNGSDLIAGWKPVASKD